MKNNIILIGLGHKARQGKDYVARYLQQNIKNINVRIMHFADELYKEVKNEDNNKPLIYLLEDQAIGLWNGKGYDFVNETLLSEKFAMWIEKNVDSWLLSRNERKGFSSVTTLGDRVQASKLRA